MSLPLRHSPYSAFGPGSGGGNSGGGRRAYASPAFLGASGGTSTGGTPSSSSSSSSSRAVAGTVSALSTSTTRCASAAEFVRRAVNLSHMDADYAFWQMANLALFSPARIHRTARYHRQTKNQWARDDPAFIAILTAFVCVASLAYSVAFQRPSGALGLLRAALYSVLVDFYALGVALATLFWWCANTFLRRESGDDFSMMMTAESQRVEWLYAFDVHCNSFFGGVFAPLYVVQFFLLRLLVRSALLSNALYAAGFGYYFYVTWLGYDVLPFLQGTTTVLLYPIVGVALVLGAAALAGVNMTRVVMDAYFG